MKFGFVYFDLFLYYNVRFRFRICPKTVFCGSGHCRDTVISPLNVGVPTAEVLGLGIFKP